MKLSRIRNFFASAFILAAQICSPVFSGTAAGSSRQAFSKYSHPSAKISMLAAAKVKDSPEVKDQSNLLQQELLHYAGIKFDGGREVPKSPHKSSGDCAGHVRRVINAVLGIAIPPVETAKDMPSKLTKNGFKKIGLRKYKPELGDVVFIAPPNDKHSCGHMGMWNGERWVSDFVQASGTFGAWPYKDVSPNTKLFSFFRHPKLSGLQSGAKTEQVAQNIPEPTPSKYHAELPSALPSGADVLSVAMLIPFAVGIGVKRVSHAIPPRAGQKRDPVPPAANLLRLQWTEARKAVLKRNAALRKGEADRTSHVNLQSSVKDMRSYIDQVMQTDPVLAFQAARYICNKYGDKELFSANECSDKQAVLKLISKNLSAIASRDPTLGAQAANFVFKEAGKGELRESVRGQLPKKASRLKTLCA